MSDNDTMTDEEQNKMLVYWMTLTLMLGYNDLAFKATSIGDKTFFRLLRDQSSERFVELGGNADVFAKTDAIVEIISPHPMPNDKKKREQP